MADSSFRTELVKDATISDITSDLTFAVQSGASQTTYQNFPATSPSNSSIVFSVQLPSESIVMGRDVILQTGLTFTASFGSSTLGSPFAVPVGQPAVIYGENASLAPFPFSSLLTTVNAQINNTNVSINLQDVLPQILQMNSRDYLAYYNGMTPSLPDGDWGLLVDAPGANNNPMAGFANTAYDNKIQGRGGFPMIQTVVHQIFGGGTDASLISTNVQDTWLITYQTLVNEPLFLSPFTWGNPERNAQGMVGINNMSFTFNIDATLKRIFSCASPYLNTTQGIGGLAPGSPASPNLFTTLGSIGGYAFPSNPTLRLKFLSTQPSDLIEAKNVVPYTDFPRYITPSNATTSIVQNATATIYSQNLQLNQMPSKIIVVARKPMASLTARDASVFLTISGISVNLNNASGLLSSASQMDLWRLSTRNGSNQTWEQFTGFANVLGDGPLGINLGISPTLVPTGGSMLVLNPAYDLSLPDYIAPGSLGNYNLQFNLQVINQFSETITPEIVIICVNDGIMTTTQGVSSTYTGILTKQLVLDSKSMRAVPSTKDDRMIGGRPMTGLVRHGYHNAHRQMSGCGTSGGAKSGGVMSGGAMGKRYSHLLK
jgi:hypothetical protein